jgi:hypothetical protein
MFHSPGSHILLIKPAGRRLRSVRPRVPALAAAVTTAGLLALPVQAGVFAPAAQAAPLNAQASCCTVQVNKPPATVKITRAGASARFTFRGSAGEMVSEVLTNVVTSDDGCETVTLLNPSHGKVDSASYCGNGNNVGVGPDTLTVPGVYTVQITLDSTATGSGKLWVSKPVNQGAIVVNKAAQPMDLKRVGQGLERSFTGHVGEQVSEVITNVVTSDDGCETVTLLNPSHGKVDSASYCGNGNNVGVGPDTLTVPGTYTILVQIDTVATGSVKLWLSEPVGIGTVAVNGPAKPMDVTRVGQGVWRTFSGHAGQNVTAVVKNIVTTDDGCETVTVLTSGGAQVANGSYCGNGNPVSAGPAKLPKTGTYKVLYQVDTTATGTGKLTVST